LNVGYGFNDKGEGEPVRLLKLKSFFVFNTSNTPEERECSVFHDPLESIWKNCIADFLGAPQFWRSTFRVVVTSTDEERRVWIEECVGRVAEATGVSRERL
jgi:NAD(P)H dehydrogenase (quinone)